MPASKNPAPRHPSASQNPVPPNAAVRQSRAASQDSSQSQNPPTDKSSSSDNQPREHSQPPTSDVYQRITDQIVAQVEAGAGEWRMPWHSADARGLPVNAVSRKPYRGGNILPLWIAAAAAGYESHEWATYKQWSEAGAQVRKGERSSLVVFWKFRDQEDVPDATQPEFNDRASRLVLVRGYSVFNAAQVEGYAPKQAPQTPELERIQSAETFFRRTQATIRTGGGRAFYSPVSDEIVVPRLERFPSAVSYYSVLAHELTHWTGHETRLDRDLLASAEKDQPMRKEDYAREELVAELGAAFLCADLELANQPRKDNAAYVASWLKVLKGDPKAIFSAASKAQYAADYLHALQPVMPQPEDVMHLKSVMQPEPSRSSTGSPGGFSAARRPAVRGPGL